MGIYIHNNNVICGYIFPYELLWEIQFVFICGFILPLFLWVHVIQALSLSEKRSMLIFHEYALFVVLYIHLLRGFMYTYFIMVTFHYQFYCVLYIPPFILYGVFYIYIISAKATELTRNARTKQLTVYGYHIKASFWLTLF